MVRDAWIYYIVELGDERCKVVAAEWFAVYM